MRLPLLLIGLLSFSHTLAAPGAAQDPMHFLVKLVDPAQGIGPRLSSSPEEKKAADFIQSSWQQQGYQVTRTPFTYTLKDTEYSSENLEILIPGQSSQEWVIGGHYDTKGKGSHGATDNGSGVALMLALSGKLQGNASLPFSVRLIAFGAEEVSLQGSKHYVSVLSDQARQRMLGMVNLDTIAGGDNLYIHSAHSTPYQCTQGPANYASPTWLRDALLAMSSSLLGDNVYRLQPGNPSYPAGETGGWSDHAPFACAGIAIANVEATNFNINGKEGFDGYSQSTHQDLWTCFDDEANSSCNRDKEVKWGHIWHTENDRLDKLEAMFPGRLQTQLQQTLDVLYRFVTTTQSIPTR